MLTVNRLLSLSHAHENKIQINDTFYERGKEEEEVNCNNWRQVHSAPLLRIHKFTENETTPVTIDTTNI